MAAICWSLAGAFGASAESGDSLRLRRPVEVRGGEVLSVRAVRQELPAEADRVLGREAIESALARLGTVLIDHGHHEARLRLEADAGGGARVVVEEGPVARWDTLYLSTSRAESRGASSGGGDGSPERRAIARGERFAPRDLERLLERWMEGALEEGRPFAAARIESLSVEGGRVRAGARLDLGPYCRVADVEFSGVKTTRPSFLRRWLRFRPDRPYRESYWAEAGRRLERTGLLVSAGEPEVIYLGEERVRVRLPLEEGRHNRIEGAMGYSGRARTLSGFVDLDLGNLFGAGRSLALRWDRLRRDQSRLRLAWRERLLGPLPLGSSVILDQEDQDSTFSRLVLEGRLETALGRELVAYAGAEYHRSLLGVEPAERVRRISSLVGLRWDALRPGAWEGRLLDASVRSGRSRIRPPEGGIERRVRLERGSLVLEETRALRGSFAARLRAVGEAIGRNDPLPLSDALRFGGARTVRGFEEESFLARRFLAVQAECGPVFDRAQLYLFADGAFWRTFPLPGSDRDALGFGLGLRSEDSGRRLALDIGVPRGGALGDGRLHIRLESRF